MVFPISGDVTIKSLSTFYMIIQLGIIYIGFMSWRSFKNSDYGKFFMYFTIGWVVIFLCRFNEWWFEMGFGPQAPLYDIIFATHPALPPLNAIAILYTLGVVIVAYSFWILYKPISN